LEWYPEKCDPVASASFIPARWSRRRPAATDDMKSVASLCCPVQSQEGWSFVTALPTFLKGDWDGVENRRLLPARQLDFNDPLIHDEFAEWMMTPQHADAVSDVVGRLGVKARAAGISLVFAAQRPDANVMPMQLRANLGNRLVLRMDGEGTSEIALGEKGAERLLGKGHLAAKLEGAPEIIYGQVPFVDSEFLAQIVAGIR
jgi:hypothetical protein